MFILSLFAALAARADTPVEQCRRALAHVVTEKRALTEEELLAFIEAPLGTSPAHFATWANDIERQVFLDAFGGLLKGPDGPAVAEALRAEAKRLAALAKEAEARRSGTRRETKTNIRPRLVGVLPARNTMLGAPTVFSLDGQTRIAAGMSPYTGLRIYNPFDFTHRELPHSIATSRAPLLVDSNSRPWFAFTASNKSRDSIGGVYLDGTPTTNFVTTGAEIGGDLGPFAITLRGQTWLTTTNSREHGLTFYPVDQPAAQPFHLAKGELGVGAPPVDVWRGADGPFVVATRLDTDTNVFVADPTNQLTYRRDIAAVRHAKFFADAQGKPWLLYAGARGLHVGPPTEREATNIFENPVENEPLIFSRNGVPHAAFIARDGGRPSLKLLNLHDRSVVSGGIAGDTTAEPSHFKFRDRDYLVWGTAKGEISVVDLADPMNIITRKICDDSLGKITPFVTEHGVSAVTRNLTRMARLRIVELLAP